MHKVLISSCLVGTPVRYDGRDAARAWTNTSYLLRWYAEGRVLTMCPEVAGGLSTPRPAAELRTGHGADLPTGAAAVIGADGQDLTSAFQQGAQATLQVALAHGVRVAVLKEASPSCGSSRVYDGTFAGRTVPGAGVTTQLLWDHGIVVFSEDQAAEADALLRSLDAGGTGVP
jgi:uncharacterized protein YbbK (DUF523 family)